jgi:sporulation protein YlmC with PRC-barrel domain
LKIISIGDNQLPKKSKKKKEKAKKEEESDEEKSNFIQRENIVGKQVIDTEGMVVGTVSDISVDIEDKKIAFNVSARSGDIIDIPSEDIDQVGDVVILKKTLDPEVYKPKEEPEAKTAKTGVSATAPPPEPNKCPKCNFVNDPSSKFCIKCGTKLK